MKTLLDHVDPEVLADMREHPVVNYDNRVRHCYAVLRRQATVKHINLRREKDAIALAADLLRSTEDDGG